MKINIFLFVLLCLFGVSVSAVENNPIAVSCKDANPKITGVEFTSKPLSSQMKGELSFKDVEKIVFKCVPVQQTDQKRFDEKITATCDNIQGEVRISKGGTWTAFSALRQNADHAVNCKVFLKQ